MAFRWNAIFLFDFFIYPYIVPPAHLIPVKINVVRLIDITKIISFDLPNVSVGTTFGRKNVLHWCI